MKGKNIYAFIPIGVALVVGGIQTAIIGNAFTAEAWYIAALLIGCVWLTAGMDAAAFHYSAINGATRAQKLFLAISAISLVIVLAVDLVWMFAPDAFNTDDAIIRDLSYATGINLAVSTLCLLGWIFFSEEHASDRKANQERLDVILQERLAALRSPEAQSLYQQLARAEIMHEVMQANRDLRSIINTAPKQLFAPEQALPPVAPPSPYQPAPPPNVNQTFHSAAPVIHMNSGQDAPRPQQPSQPQAQTHIPTPAAGQYPLFVVRMTFAGVPVTVKKTGVLSNLNEANFTRKGNEILAWVTAASEEDAWERAKIYYEEWVTRDPKA